MNETILAWQNGDVTDAQALRALCTDLGEIESGIAPLQAERDAIRSVLTMVVERMGGKASVAGFGALALTAGGETVSYDRAKLDTLAAELLATGDTELIRIAAAIAQARTVARRAAGLRVTRER